MEIVENGVDNSSLQTFVLLLAYDIYVQCVENNGLFKVHVLNLKKKADIL